MKKIEIEENINEKNGKTLNGRPIAARGARRKRWKIVFAEYGKIPHAPF